MHTQIGGPDKDSTTSKPSQTPPKPSVGNKIISPNPHQQSQSPFFNVPLEIRLLIYKSLLDTRGWGSSIHIITSQYLEPTPAIPWEPVPTSTHDLQKLDYIPCAASLGDPFLISGTHYGHWPRGHLACSQLAKWRVEGGSESHGSIDAMGVCRRMHEEMADCLYGVMKFEILGLVACDRFLTNLMPVTLEKIKSLHLSFRTSTDSRAKMFEKLSRVCDFLPSMASLQDLKIAIYDDGHPKLSETELLEPILAVEMSSMRGEFVVELGFVEEEQRDFFGDAAPFTVIRREKEDNEEANIYISRAVQTGGRRRLLNPLRVLWRRFSRQ